LLHETQARTLIISSAFTPLIIIALLIKTIIKHNFYNNLI
jgi:hypothetical protein